MRSCGGRTRRHRLHSSRLLLVSVLVPLIPLLCLLLSTISSCYPCRFSLAKSNIFSLFWLLCSCVGFDTPGFYLIYLQPSSAGTNIVSHIYLLKCPVLPLFILIPLHTSKETARPHLRSSYAIGKDDSIRHVVVGLHPCVMNRSNK